MKMDVEQQSEAEVPSLGRLAWKPKIVKAARRTSWAGGKGVENSPPKASFSATFSQVPRHTL